MAGTERGKRRVLPDKGRTALRIGIVAAVLAVVIIGVGVVSNIMQPSKPIVELPGSATMEPGAADYASGMNALATGDVTTAVELLRTSALDGNADAAAQLDKMKQSEATSSTPTSGTPVVAPDSYTKPVADLATLLPKSLAGFEFSQVETSGRSVILEASPVPGTTAKATHVVYTVVDKQTPEGARAWYSGAAQAFPKNLSNVQVGSVLARFGTQGKNLAAITFIRGRYGFEVILTTTDGKPAQLLDDAVIAAKAFAATK